MTDVTQDMILEYILRKGGMVKNVDLVRHFKKHLQVEDPRMKDRAREAFKEKVNSVAYIKAERGDKFLHLRPQFELKLNQPPPGRIPNGQRSSISSAEDAFSPRKQSLNQRDSFSYDLKSPVKSSPPPKPITNSREPVSNSIAGSSSLKNTAVLNSYKPVSTPPPPSNSMYSPPSSSKPGPSMDFDLGGSDFGSSLFAQLDSFGSSLFTNDTGSSSLATSGKTSLSASNVTSSSRQTGLSSSNVDSSSHPTSSSSSYLGSPSRQTDPSSSKVDSYSGSPSRQTSPSSSKVDSYSGSTSRQTGLTTGDSSYRGSSLTAPNSTSGPTARSSNNIGQSHQTTTQPSYLSSHSAVKSSVPQVGDRASSGYGSLGKASTHSTITPSTTLPSSSANKSGTSSLFDDLDTMLAGLDSSISMSLFGDTPSKPSSSTVDMSVSSNGPGSSLSSPPSSVYSKPTAPSTSSTPSKTANSNSGTGHSYNSTPPKTNSGTSSRPMRESTQSMASVTSTGSSKSLSSTSPALTNGTEDVKHVSSRRPPPGPSPVPKRPAPKPPTRKSSEQKESPLMANTLGRHTTTTNSHESYGSNTQSLGRQPHPPRAAEGVVNNPGGRTEDPSRGTLGSLGLDFLSSFGSFGSSVAGTSLDSGPPPPSQPPPHSQQAPPTQTGHSRSPDIGRPRTSTEDAPTIRIDSPTKSSDMSSHTGRISPLTVSESGRGRSPTYTSLGPRPHHDSAERLGHKTHNDSNERIPAGVVLRTRPPSNIHSSSRRTSRNFDKTSNLENKTRHMIMATPPTGRRSLLMPAPEVAPKPANSSHEFPPARSREDVSQYGDEEGSGSMQGTEPDYWDIDPYEKEWMLANAEGNMETIHRLFMTESSLVNRKDFLHGYTAMHWAAKHGRCDLITALAMNGAMFSLKSNGLTPLHLAAASGHDNAIQFLVQEYDADVNARDHGGRRPVDILSPKCQLKTKAMLSNIDNHGLPVPSMHWVNNLSSFSRPRSASTLSRTWSSVGDIDRRHHASEPTRRRNSPKSIRKSFSFKRTRINKVVEPASLSKKDKKAEKKSKKLIAKRPHSDAHSYSIRDKNWDV